MSRTDPDDVQAVVRDAIARTVAIVGLAGFALIHLLDLPDTITSTPYLGWMYIGLMIAALGLAGALVLTSDTRVWLAASALVASVIAGYVLSRTTGLPSSTDDIGNWRDPLGIAMLFVGGSLLALGGGVVAARSADRRQRAGAQPRAARPALSWAAAGRPRE